MIAAARPLRLLVLALCLALATVFFPVQPVVAVEVAPQTRSETISVGGDRLGTDDESGSFTAQSAPVARRSDVLEAPMPFTGLGITGDGETPALRVRTLDLDGDWSDWADVGMLDDADGPDDGTDEAAAATIDLDPDSGTWSSDAVWAGPSSHVQLEVSGADPDDLDVTFMDSAGLSEPLLERVGRTLRSRTTATPAEAASDAPTIRPRTDWLPGGVEHRSGTPSAADVEFTVLHHTATTNDYSREQAPQQIRNMHHWHTDNNGWDDLGYNFVVDRFGTVWEGRYGGITRGVVGAHAGGWNTGSFGVAMMGNYNTAQPEQRAMDAAVELIAWKYRIHGIDPDPAARVDTHGTSIRTLEGHRNVRQTYIDWKAGDAFAEDCPGRNLSWRLPTLREDIATVYSASAVPPGPFTDISTTHTFHDQVAWMADEGLTTGYADGTFQPTEPVTRAALAAFLHRAAGAPAGPFPDPGFSDVPSSHPFRNEVAWLVEEGVASGYEDDTFRPQEPVTRQAVASMLHRAVDAPAGEQPSSTSFTDVYGDHPFGIAIQWMYDTGLSTGYPDGTFGPERTTSRQAVAAFLHAWSQLES